MADICKKCGKKMGFEETLLGYTDLCIGCFDEEKKRHKGHCEECGKEVDDRRFDVLCSECEIKHKLSAGIKFKAEYLGGYAAYPEPLDVKILTYPDHLEVQELEFSIPYNQLQNVQSMTEERYKVSHFFCSAYTVLHGRNVRPTLLSLLMT